MCLGPTYWASLMLNFVVCCVCVACLECLDTYGRMLSTGRVDGQ